MKLPLAPTRPVRPAPAPLRPPAPPVVHRPAPSGDAVEPVTCARPRNALVKLGPDGIVVHKVRSTPEDPAEAILRGIEDVGGAEGGADVVHGSTVATNAVLERKGARVALLATAGFEDVLHIGRQTRRELYNLMVEGRRPLVEAALTFGVDERLDADGRVLVPIEPSAIEDLAERLRRSGATAVAVCFLHAYRNAVHEELVREILECSGLAVSASHRVLCEYREFERWSTTVVNAYVGPALSRYLSRLSARLSDAGYRGPVLIM